ncbi:hypothetical protein ATANTOWER_005532 [Ataeniobius toweri]|uniref:Uncharacterized protein n=1 Tax=Ataeniobius toweri TaxID=208326 RepID=A0ABU7BWY1_9TELE|nr:hypothetical protein [Ataeniobius toweri]
MKSDNNNSNNTRKVHLQSHILLRFQLELIQVIQRCYRLGRFCCIKGPAITQSTLSLPPASVGVSFHHLIQHPTSGPN